MNAIYKLLTLNRNACISTFNKLRRLKGFDCKVILPQEENQTIFGLEDLVPLDFDNAQDMQLLIFNVTQEDFIGMEGYDAFLDGCFVLTRYEERFPLQTVIQVNFYGRLLTYKVDDHRNLTPHITEQLFIKNMLVAAT